MPAHRLDMRLFKEVLRLKLTARLSHRQIASALRIGVGTVSNYLAAFERSGLPFPLPDGMDEAELSRLLFPPTAVSSAPEFAVPDFSDIHEQLRLKGVTRQLLWEEYCHEHGSRSYSYTQFCVRYRKWVGRRKLSMRQTHRPGEKMFVDYCGKTIPIIDAATGEITEAVV